MSVRRSANAAKKHLIRDLERHPSAYFKLQDHIQRYEKDDGNIILRLHWIAGK
jgi:hypothetical protein